MSWLRREPAAAAALAPMPQIVADLAGASISGQVAIGDNNVQIHAEHGAIVNYTAAPLRPVPRLRSGPVRRLPRDFPQLVGREQQLSFAAAQAALGTPVELLGPPGIGKTALARRLAHRSAGETQLAVLFTWCGNQPVADLQQFLFDCLYECDVPLVPAPSQLGAYLHGQRALVILDDVDLDSTQLGRLMDSLPDGAFVCTAQSRRLWGEGRAIELPGLDPQAAVALVEYELGRPLDGAEQATARDLATTLHGHPLAILEAAARMRATRAFPSTATTFGDPLLGALAALPGTPVPTPDLAAVTRVADATRELEALEARHLVQAHSPRYSLVDGLAPATDGAGWRRHLLEHFVATGAAPGEERGRALRAEYAAPPILALLAQAEAAGRPADVLALARAADGLLALGGRWGAWGVLLEHALRAARALGDRESEAWALHQLGSRALCLEDAAHATASLTGALELRERLGDEQGAAITRHNLTRLDGGGPGPQSDGGHDPRPPALTLLLALAALAILAAGVGATSLLPGKDPVAIPAATTKTGEAPPDDTTSTGTTDHGRGTTTGTSTGLAPPPPPPPIPTQPPETTKTEPAVTTETLPPDTSTVPATPEDTGLTLQCPDANQPQNASVETPGKLSPGHAGAAIRVIYRHSGGRFRIFTTTTDDAGAFSTALPATIVGDWTGTAYFDGDANYLKAVSDPCRIGVG